MNTEAITKQALVLKRAQSAIMTLFAFTIINIMAPVLGMNINFLFSAVIPELIAILTIPAWGLLSALVYFGLWFWMKKWPGAVLITLILFVIDSLILLGLILLSGAFGDFLFNILFSAWILHNLITGTIAWAKLKNVDSSMLLESQNAMTVQTETENLVTAAEIMTAIHGETKVNSEIKTPEFDFTVESLEADDNEE